MIHKIKVKIIEAGDDELGKAFVKLEIPNSFHNPVGGKQIVLYFEDKFPVKDLAGYLYKNAVLTIEPAIDEG